MRGGRAWCVGVAVGVATPVIACQRRVAASWSVLTNRLPWGQFERERERERASQRGVHFTHLECSKCKVLFACPPACLSAPVAAAAAAGRPVWTALAN